MKKTLLLFSLLLISILGSLKAQTGVDCNNSISISLGSTTGNGSYNQYYKFTPGSSGYYNLYSSSTDYCTSTVYSGNCNALSQVVNGYSMTGSPLLFYAEAGITYTINMNYLYNYSFVLESTNQIGKEIRESYVLLGNDYYYARIDTVSNTLTYTVPSDAVLTNVTYSIARLNPKYTTLSVGGSSIPDYGSFNLNTLSEIEIKANDGSKATYTVSVIKKEGISCSSAFSFSDARVKGNGESVQYYTFTPTSTNYYNLRNSKNSYYATVYKGTCNSLTLITSLNLYQNNPLLFYGESGVNYIIKTEGQNTDSLIREKATQIPKEFTYFKFRKNSEYYSTKIDTVKNTITVTVPSNIDLSGMYYELSKTASIYTEVSANGKTIPSSGTEDFSGITSLLITAKDGSTATYYLIFNKVDGMNCPTAKVITKSKTSGIEVSHQYFSYTPENTKYVKIYTTGAGIDASLYSGSCGSLTPVITSSYINFSTHMEFKANAGTPYILDTYNLYGGILIVEDLLTITKEFTSFQIYDGSDYYNGNIDTVNNTISVSIPEELNLSVAKCFFSKTGFELTSVSIGGKKINSAEVVDLSNVSTLVITADDGSTQTYSLTLKRVKALNCVSPITANYGINKGNGDAICYFKFTPDETGYVSMYPAVKSTNFYLLSGDCGNLTSVKTGNSSLYSPLSMKLEGGKTYYLKTNNLYDQSVVIKKIKLIRKEFNYFYIYDEKGNYTASIDTIENIVKFKVPANMDLSHLNYYFDLSMRDLNNVFLNNSAIPYYGTIDLTKITSLQIKAKDGTSAVYTLNIEKDNNLDCSGIVEITEGITTGDGKVNQYYSYTASESGFVKISSESAFSVAAYTGDCASLSSLKNGWLGKSQDFVFPVAAGTKYIISTRGQLIFKFKLTFVKSEPLEFSKFSLDNGSSEWHYGVIDTVANTVTFKVPSGFNKIGPVGFSFYGNLNLAVKVNDLELENYSLVDLNNVNSVVITNKVDKSASYSIIFEEVPGAECASAKTISEGITSGIGSTHQYFDFVPAKSGYIKVSALDDYFYLSMQKGTCNSNVVVASNNYIQLDQPKTYKVEAGKNYILSFNGLLTNRFSINYVSSIRKDVNTAELIDGSAYYYGVVDTVANTISFKVSSDLDLSVVSYTFNLTDPDNTYIIANGDSISSVGTKDLTNLNSFTVKASDGTTVNYTVTFTKTNVPLFLLNAGCTLNGSITPSGLMSVEKGSDITFTITPDNNCVVKYVVTDNEYLASTNNNSYTFSNITEAHSFFAYFEKTLGVNDISGMNTRVFPNPFASSVNIETEAGSMLRVFNAQGIKIFEGTNDKDSKSIDLSGYPKGLYIIEVSKGEKVKKVKAIKQ